MLKCGSPPPVQSAMPTKSAAQSRNHDVDQTANKNLSPPLPSDRVYDAIVAAYKAIPGTLGAPGDFSFTRHGPLSAELLTTFLMYMVADGNRLGIRHLVLNFWEDANAQGICVPLGDAVSASAICQARQRLPENLFRHLLAALAAEADRGPGQRTWRGKRVYAVDAAQMNVKPNAELQEAFRVSKGAYTPLILMSTMVDVFTRMPVNYEIDGRIGVGEREHLLRMLPSIKRGDLLILDRGYPSYEVLRMCAVAGIDYLVRCQNAQTFDLIDSFRESGCADQCFTVDVCVADSSEITSLDVRAVRVEGPDGPAFYVTSLPTEIAPVEEIAKLYHLRWQVEEYFKLFTSEYVGQKQFRSTSARGVRQEVGALTLFLAMTRLLAVAAEVSIDEASDTFVSQKGAVVSFARSLIPILLDDDAQRVRARIVRTIERILKTLDRRRPGRSYLRRSLKPRRKWGPRGKTRA